MSDSTPEESTGLLTSEVPADPAPPEQPSKPRRRALIEWGAIIIIAVLVSFVMRVFAFQTFVIPSISMVPTLQVGDRIIVNKLAISWGTINVGDIVVFKAPTAAVKACNEVEPVTDFVKRVIGVPGDSLKSKGNTIYVNNKPLDETWTHTEPLGQAITPITLKANQYFMMGDNHSDSCDSRMWGTVPRSDIIGKAFLRIWPVSRIGFL